MKKRIGAVILMLCMSFALLAACTENGNDASTTTTTTQPPDNSGENNEDPAETTEEPQEQKILSEAPVEDYGGVQYRILGNLLDLHGNGHWVSNDLYAEEETGDTIVDAVYKRNKAIEAKFNVNITKVENADPATLARTAIQAGSDEYDVIYAGLPQTLSLAQSGFLVSLHDVPHLDLEKPWYDQNANAQLSIGKKLYTTFTNFTILDKNATWVYLFNKQLIADLGLEDPYVLVREGKWTIDKLIEMSKAAAKDLDGDGVMGNWDQYGYMGESFNMYAGIIASDVVLFPKDTNDYPTYNGVTERASTAFTKLLELLGSKDLALRAEDITGKGFSGGNLYADVMDVSFMEGRILFNNAGMNRVTLFRSMEIDFGIIPSPKFDEAQPNYYNTLTAYYAPSLSIPTTLDDDALERVGAVTDSLCAESMYTLIPAYYETQLKTKLVRDNESGEMMDMIFANRRFDLGQLYGFGGITTILNQAMTNNNPNITSTLERAAGRVQTAINKLIQAYDEIG